MSFRAQRRWGVLVAALTTLGTGVTAPALGAQSAATDSATLWFREAMAALGRNDGRRAESAFDRLRSQYPASPYAQESYAWQAQWLARRGDARSRAAARQLLDEQAYGFPAAATQEDVEALRVALDSAPQASRERAAAAPCPQAPPEERFLTLLATLSVDVDAARVMLARLLASRATCDVPLQRSAMLVLDAAGRFPDREAMLRVVQARHHDSVTVARARRALAGTLTPVLPLVPPAPLSVGGGAAAVLGDTLAVPLRFVARDVKGVTTTLYLDAPAYLVQLHVSPAGGVELVSTVDGTRASPTPVGPLQVAPPRRAFTVAVEDRQAMDAENQRRDLQREACEARAQQAADDAARRARQPRDSTGRAPASTTAQMQAQAQAMARCQSAQPSLVTTQQTRRETRLGSPETGYQLILASPLALDRFDILARLGTLSARPVEGPADLDAMVRTVFGAHPAPWMVIAVRW